ncbi:MAG TPA: hypothetical protein VML53_01470 [Thermoplasmata archaeon]|nr:hypothetical protein [Thermoplasmata archaeon]
MVKRWAIVACATLAVVAMTGVGFSAFTSSVTVNGYALSAYTDLQIVNYGVAGCGAFYGATAPGPGNISFFGEDEAANEISLVAYNLVPASYCYANITIENTGSEPLNASVVLNTPGANGICTANGTDCYDVFTATGIMTQGWVCFSVAPNCLTNHTATYAEYGFVTLQPGQTFTDLIGMDIPPLSDNNTPSIGYFSLVYTGSAGY